MTEIEMGMHCCCFTEHRPEKISHTVNEVCEGLKKEIHQAIADGYNVFITGMARGVDIWAAEIVLDMRKLNKDIELICASPYEGFESSWKAEWQGRYKQIIESANRVYYISPSYSRSCFQARNKWMVDHSTLLIAVYSGEKGGTQNTIDYARKHAIDVRITTLE
ncbi:MAG: SLOG family protein [Eubacteriales bacterium]